MLQVEKYDEAVENTSFVGRPVEKDYMRVLCSRICACGKKLLLQITKDSEHICGISLYPEYEPEGRTLRFTRRSDILTDLSLRYMVCLGCNRRVQVRTIDAIEEYLDKTPMSF